jgi:hypothetical protein
VALWTSHPPQEKDGGFESRQGNIKVQLFINDLIACLLKKRKREIKALAQKY